MPSHTAFDRPRPTLPGLAVVIALHALALFAFVSGDRIMRLQTPQMVLLLATVPPETVEPPPPPPPPRSLPHDSTPLPPVPKVAVPPLRDIDVVPHTEVAATIVDNTMPVEAAGGKLDGTGTAGPGDVGEGTGSGRAAVRARASVISWRRRSTAYPYDRGSCSGSGGRMIDTLRVLQHDIQRKRQLARAGVFVFTAWRNVPDRGLRACLRTPPPAIHRARP